MNPTDIAKFFLNPQTWADAQTHIAEPFLRGLSPLPVENLPGIGKNFHKADQSLLAKLATGLGLATQTGAAYEATAPLQALTKGAFLTKTLGPNIASHLQNTINAARIGLATPLGDSQNLDALKNQRLAQARGGLVTGGLGGITPAISSAKVALNGGVGGNTLGFANQAISNPLALARNVAALGGGLAEYLHAGGNTFGFGGKK